SAGVLVGQQPDDGRDSRASVRTDFSQGLDGQMPDPTVSVSQRLQQQRDGRLGFRNDPAQGSGSSGADVGVVLLQRLDQSGERCPSLGPAGCETQASNPRQLRVSMLQRFNELAFLCQTVHNLEQVVRGRTRAVRFGGILESNYTVTINDKDRRAVRPLLVC